MKSNNSTGGFTEIATVAMQALNPTSTFDGGGRNVTALPNSLDFSDILKFGTLGAGVGCAKGPNSRDFLGIIVGVRQLVGYISNHVSQVLLARLLLSYY
jgi:hypothetical protein